MPFGLILMMALTADAAAPGGGAAAPAAIADCREIRKDKARLACFDRAADGAKGASPARAEPVGMGASTVARRREVRVARKEPARIEAVAQAAQPLANGRWRITLGDGAVWRTTEPVTAVEPRGGQRIVITRSPIGSYFINIDNTIGVRGLREK